MSFSQLKDRFEAQIMSDSLWNIPTNTRIETIHLFNELDKAPLTPTEKNTELRARLNEIVSNYPISDIEAQQMAFLTYLLAENRFSDHAKKAILEDLASMELNNAVVA